MRFQIMRCQDMHEVIREFIGVVLDGGHLGRVLLLLRGDRGLLALGQEIFIETGLKAKS